MRSFIFSLSMLSIIACNGDAPTDTDAEIPDDTDVVTAEPAAFADATEAERMEAVNVGLGLDSMFAVFAVLTTEFDAAEAILDGDPDTNCPVTDVLSEEPLSVKFSAQDCTAPSDTTYDGSLTADNFSFIGGIFDATGTEGSFEGPMALTFADFTVETPDSASSFDGSIAQSETAWGVDYTSSIDLTSTLDGRARSIAMDLDCEYAGEDVSCAIQPGAVATLDGLGRFEISGEFSMTAMTGRLVLTGADEMVLDFDATVDGCVPVTVDGVAMDPLCYEEGEDAAGGRE